MLVEVRFVGHDADHFVDVQAVCELGDDLVVQSALGWVYLRCGSRLSNFYVWLRHRPLV